MSHTAVAQYCKEFSVVVVLLQITSYNLTVKGHWYARGDVEGPHPARRRPWGLWKTISEFVPKVCLKRLSVFRTQYSSCSLIILINRGASSSTSEQQHSDVTNVS